MRIKDISKDSYEKKMVTATPVSIKELISIYHDNIFAGSLVPIERRESKIECSDEEELLLREWFLHEFNNSFHIETEEIPKDFKITKSFIKGIWFKNA